jgi:4-hydroxy-3-methylbut-2-enyl diphosphate reductase
MKIFIAAHAGFCKGVQRAVRIAEDAAAQAQGPVFTLGPLIHNPRVVRTMHERGVRTAPGPDFDFPANATVVLPSHGTPAHVMQALQERGLTLVQAACPRVLAVHERIKKALAQGRSVFLAGDPGHTEAAAAASLDPARITVAASPRDVQRANPPDAPSFLAAQTTFSPAIFRAIDKELSQRIWDLDVFDSLCGHTLSAQQAAARLAAQCSIMVVVGGGKSANTERLREACKSACARVRRVDSASALRRAMFRADDRVGITAGASTPPEHIREVRDWLCARFEID